jgi:hypothetical protein
MNVSHAATYYLSASTGNDSYTAAQAQNQSTPWKTLAKMSSYMANIRAGDNILLKRGDTFPGSFVVNASGTSSLPITISSYGTATDAPIITAPVVTGWVNASGIYSVTYRNHAGQSILYEDGMPLPSASSASLADGRWYGNNKTLYYRPASGTSSNHTISLADIDSTGYIPAINLSNCRYVTVSGITFNSVGVGVKTFDTYQGTIGLVVQKCNFYLCHTGVLFMPDKWNNTNALVQSNYFYRNHCGVRMYTTAAAGARPGQTWGTNIACTISYNEMSQVGTTDGTTHWAYGSDYEAIGLQNFMSGTISNNYVHDGFQIGIIFWNLVTRNSDNNMIMGNSFIHNGKGAIMMMGDNADQGLSGNYGFNNNFIADNLFVNSAYVGVLSGTVSIYQGALTRQNNYFVNNTLSGPYNVVYFPTSRAPYFTIENNIIYNPGTYDFVAWYFNGKPGSLTMDYNLYYETIGSKHFGVPGSGTLSSVQSMGMEKHSKFADPLFVNPGSNQYHLQSTSGAINAGINVGLSYFGTAPDIGAYEYNTGTSVTSSKTADAPTKP